MNLVDRIKFRHVIFDDIRKLFRDFDIAADGSDEAWEKFFAQIIKLIKKRKRLDGTKLILCDTDTYERIDDPETFMLTDNVSFIPQRVWKEWGMMKKRETRKLVGPEWGKINEVN